MGYENCGRHEEYPYDQLLDGQPHIIKVTTEHQLRAIRYGAARRGLAFRQQKICAGQYKILAWPEENT